MKLKFMLAAVAVPVLFGCHRVEPPCEVRSLKETTRLDVPEAVRYCRPARLQSRSASAQVLVDSSASMQGFPNLLGPFQEWNQQALSYARSYGMAWQQQRYCFFRAGAGVAPCSNGKFPASAIPAAGNTNLDEAINAARNFDLTVILTDGVAATGRQTKDCAGGVDPACVARSLWAAIQPAPGSSQDTFGGLWIVPMASLYEGPYYTDKVLPTGSFNSSMVQESVRRDTGGVARVDKTFLDKSGRLAYEYHGPRALVVLVLSKDAELGRAVVGALAARRAETPIEAISSLKDFRAGLAAMPPIEVYPGYVPQLTWRKAALGRNADGLNAICGAMDVAFDEQANLLRLGPTGDPDQAIVDLRGELPAQMADCAEIAQLPVLQVHRSNPARMDFVRAAEWKPLTQPMVQLQIEARKGHGAACGDDAPILQWRMAPDFAASADRLASNESKTAGMVDTIASDDSVNDPHRIYGLREMLVKFYRECLQAHDPVESMLAQVRICERK